MTDLVIYYTRTNTTKTASEIIAKEKGADTLEIIDKKNRDGPIQYMVGALDALRNKTTSIKYDTVDLKKYDTVYIGTPVWASKPSPAINEFIKQNNFNGVNVITFATMMSSGGDKTVNTMNDAIKQKGGKIIKSFALATKNSDIEEITLEAIKD